MEVSERFLQTALDGIQDCVNIVDKDYKIIFMNEAASRRTGKKRQLLLGSKCYSELWKESSPCESCVTGKVFETGKAQQAITWEAGLDGKKFYLEKFAFPIVDKNGKVEYAVEIFRDITERKLLEEDREQQRLELGKRVREIRHAYEELKSIQNQLLQSEKIISEQIIKCQKTIRNLLDFSRKSTCEKKIWNIHHLINNTMPLVEHRLKIHNINLRKTFDDNVPPLLVDGNQIQQVILNLVNNAVDALSQGGDMFIETRLNKEAKSVEVIFEDNGIGISNEDQKRVFEPFFTTKETGKGTGLGLSICNNIISAHNGKIALESRIGNGA